MVKILIFAGTSEGRQLIEHLIDKAQVDCCVATEYGEKLLPKESENFKITRGRMTVNDMAEMMSQKKYDLVIDTTHPYAQIVTANIKEAAKLTSSKYIRVLRASGIGEQDVKVLPDMDAAVKYLNETDKKVLLTVGSKELAKFTEVHNYKERLYARVLPMREVVKQCTELGFEGSRLICMQGPFTMAMNKAMIEQTGAQIIVSKDSGQAGGLMDKIDAANEAGIEAIVIGRPTEEEGMSLEDLKAYLKDEFDITEAAEEMELKEWFPIFISLKDKNILVVGGGKVAARRVKTLVNFAGNIAVVAPQVDEAIKEMGNLPNLAVIEKNFDFEDLDEADFVISATDDEPLNQRIKEVADEMGIPSNISSQKEQCDFYFPGIAMCGDVTVGITAQGKNHRLAKEMTENIKTFLEDKNK